MHPTRDQHSRGEVRRSSASSYREDRAGRLSIIHRWQVRFCQYWLARLLFGPLVVLISSFPAASLPLGVSIVTQEGGGVRFLVRAAAIPEPMLEWTGSGQPTPYQLALVWSGINLTLEGPLPAPPPTGTSALRSVNLYTASGSSRLVLQFDRMGQPLLRREGPLWTLSFAPDAPMPTSMQIGIPARSPKLPAPVIGPLQNGTPQPKSARGSDGKTVALPSAPERLLVNVTVNNQPLRDAVLAEQLPDGALLIPLEAWAEARLAPLPNSTALSDGTPAFKLNAVAQASWRIDRERMTLDIEVPAGAFVGTSLGLQDATTAAPPRPEPGIMLNYDLSLNHGDKTVSGGALLEAVAFNSLGSLVSSVLVSADDGARKVARLDTYWRYDLPQHMETLVVGDTVGVSGGWSRPARFGGIRWGRDFGMRPGFVTMPQLALAGSAALPSTVDVLVNNARSTSQSVQPGPFELTNVPVVTGAGELNLVVRDLLGRETIVRQSYYASPRLLAPGLSDFSFEAGLLRDGYGGESHYRDLFASATWRQGVSNQLTGEGRIELQQNRTAAGLEVVGLVGEWAVAWVAAAASAGNRQGTAESGYLLQAGVERATTTWGGSVQYERASRNFAPFAEALGAEAVSQRARERWLASVGGVLWSSVSGGLNLVRQVRWDGDRVTSLGASLSTTLWQSASLSFYADKRLDNDHSWRAGVSISMPLVDGIRGSASVDRSKDGKLGGRINAEHTAPAGPGLGWRVQAAAGSDENVQGNLQYNTSQSEITADATVNSSGLFAARAGSRGTVGWLSGVAFASRPVGQGSVAVVRVDGMAGVPVMRANQVVALTDSRGFAFVPGLQPWAKNKIEIDPVDLPLDVEVDNPVREVTPYARSGVTVDFSARRSPQALITLLQADGTPVPLGASVAVSSDAPQFVVGRRGKVWLADLHSAQQRLQVRWANGGCTLDVAIPNSQDGTPVTIGPLICSKEKQ